MTNAHQKINTKVGAVLVVGGGIAGMQAASDLADGGFLVYLITIQDSLGGRMAMLDKTFPTNECSMCLLGPRMTGSLNHANIKLLTRTTLINLSGQEGNFTAQLERQPRFVDESRCTGCGQCADTCPVKVDDEFNGGYSKRKAIYKQFPQAVPNKYAIDMDNCIHCKKCIKACSAGAIDHSQEIETLNLAVGAVILAPGFESFDASVLGQYGLGYYPNVVSNIQFERMLSSTGPTGGNVTRPSDGQLPRRLAFIQCVGSRDCRPEYGVGYCSGICCMASVKEAAIAKEHHPQVEPTIFYLDMRAHGKNFDRYVQRAENQGIKLQRSLISAVKEDPVTGNLLISYYHQGDVVNGEYDMVVLASGVRPPVNAGQLAEAAGIELNQYGFARTDQNNPVLTQRPGVFAAGGFLGPRDIPETVINGSAAAGMAAGLLTTARGTLEQLVEYPPEMDVTNQPPRVGVFICRCGTNIAGVVNVPKVVNQAANLPGVVYAGEFTYSCSQQSLQQIKDIVVEQRLNRVVVAACSVRTHLPLFKNALRECGLNNYYLEMANIRDQCSWVHREYPSEATEKAIDLVAMAVGKVRRNQPLHLETAPVVQKALVVGGGIAGMTAALTLAEGGYGVYLVERQSQLGGMLCLLDSYNEVLKKNVDMVMNHPNITVYNNAQLTGCRGKIGDFISHVTTPGRVVELHHATVIIATGNQQSPVEGYLYGMDQRVITRLELERRLTSKGGLTNVNDVVFIQCAGSRQPGREYCGRTCCNQTVKQAIEIKERSSETNVYVLYRDMRTYGFYEADYLAARERGVIFINYDLEKPPMVRGEQQYLRVDIYDPSCRMDLRLQADLVVLATGAEPSTGVEQLAGLFKLPLDENRYFVETHAKLSPLDVPAPGIFLCGGAHSPQNIIESTAQGQAAAARAATVLSKDYLLAGGAVARVTEDKCVACLTCVRVCPFGIPRIGSSHTAEITGVQCQGCGTCSGACPNGAIYMGHYTGEQLAAKVQALFNKGGGA